MGGVNNNSPSGSNMGKQSFFARTGNEIAVTGQTKLNLIKDEVVHSRNLSNPNTFYPMMAVEDKRAN